MMNEKIIIASSMASIQMDYCARMAVLESNFKNYLKSHYPSKTGLHSLIIYLSPSMGSSGSNVIVRFS
jgi:hypothetical protein